MLPLQRWYREETGEDILEYALLTGTIGLAAAVAMSVLGDAIGSSYSAWETHGQTDAMVEVPDPAGAP
jgi:Flp pilus assembly pilin Flp